MVAFAGQLIVLARTFSWAPLYLPELHMALWVMLALDTAVAVAVVATLYLVRRPLGPKPTKSPTKVPLRRRHRRRMNEAESTATSENHRPSQHSDTSEAMTHKASSEASEGLSGSELESLEMQSSDEVAIESGVESVVN